MGYQVEYDALDRMFNGLSAQTNQWLARFEQLQAAVEQLAESRNIQGSGAENIKQYIKNVHGTIIGLLANLVSLHSANCLIYKQDYQQNVDRDLHAVIKETELTSVRSGIQRNRNSAIQINNEVEYALRQVRDIFYYAYRDVSDVDAAHKSVADFLTDLDKEIKSLEARHSAADFTNSSQMIATLRAFIAEQRSQGRAYKQSFSTAELGSSAAFKDMYQAYVAVNGELQDKADALDQAIENENQRVADLQKEYEERQKRATIINWVVTGVCVVGSIALIAATGGAATPLVVAGISAASGAIVAGTRNVTGQYVANGSLSNLDLASLGKDVVVGGAIGFVTGYLNTSLTNVMWDSTLGSTLLHSGNGLVRIGTGAVIGSVSKVTSGIIGRGGVTLVASGFDTQEAMEKAFEGKSIAIDAVGGAVSGGYKASKIVPKLDKAELKDGPYIKDGKPNGRPSLSGEEKLKFEQEIYDKQIADSPDGLLRDPHTGEVIDWRPGEGRSGVVDFGHKTGEEYIDMFNKYKAGEITLEELKEFQFNPDNYYLETPSSNRSHIFEGRSN